MKLYFYSGSNTFSLKAYLIVSLQYQIYSDKVKHAKYCIFLLLKNDCFKFILKQGNYTIGKDCNSLLRHFKHTS